MIGVVSHRNSFCRLSLACVCCLELFSISTVAVCQTHEGMLQEAVDQYRQALEAKQRDERLARFGRAELLFSQLASSMPTAAENRWQNPELLVNLGNAALGAERLGPAIVAYRRALESDPSHRRAQQNLRHARSQLPEWVPRPVEESFLDSFFSFHKHLTSELLQSLAAVVFLLAAATFAGSLRWRMGWLRGFAVLTILAWSVLMSLELVRALRPRLDAAVVIVAEVIARSADSHGAPARLPQPLPSGTELVVLDQRDQWLRVRLADGRDAWLPSGSVERITPTS